jgi:arginyl-tRNA synthetase
VKEWEGDIDSLFVNKKEMKFSNDDELSLTKLIVSYEIILVEALDKISPHIIATYLLSLATEFNRFYKFNSVLKADDSSKETRIIITNAMAVILKNGLNILGIKVLDRM